MSGFETDGRDSRLAGSEVDLGPLSPELCLVDAELARRARSLLPDRGEQPQAHAGGAAPAGNPGKEPAQPTPAAEPPQRRPGRLRRAPSRLAVYAAAVLIVVGTLALVEVVRWLDPAPGPQLEPSVSATGSPQPPPRTVPRITTPSPGREVNVLDDLAEEIGQSTHWAVTTFGAPTRRERRGEYCRVHWSPLSLTVVFAAAPGREPCANGQMVGGVVRRRRWRTAKGLRVGDSVRELRDRYPKAEARAAGWWWIVVVRRVMLGEPRRLPLLTAHVRDGRIDRFVVGWSDLLR